MFRSHDPDAGHLDGLAAAVIDVSDILLVSLTAHLLSKAPFAVVVENGFRVLCNLNRHMILSYLLAGALVVDAAMYHASAHLHV